MVNRIYFLVSERLYKDSALEELCEGRTVGTQNLCNSVYANLIRSSLPSAISYLDKKKKGH